MSFMNEHLEDQYIADMKYKSDPELRKQAMDRVRRMQITDSTYVDPYLHDIGEYHWRVKKYKSD